MRINLMALAAVGLLGVGPAADRLAIAQTGDDYDLPTVNLKSYQPNATPSSPWPSTNPGVASSPGYSSSGANAYSYQAPSTYSAPAYSASGYSFGTVPSEIVTPTGAHYSGYPSYYGFPYSYGHYGGDLPAHGTGYPATPQLTYGLPAYRYIMAAYGLPPAAYGGTSTTTYYGGYPTTYGSASYYENSYPSSYGSTYPSSSSYGYGAYGGW